VELTPEQLPGALEEALNAFQWAAMTAGTRTVFIGRKVAIASFNERFTSRNKFQEAKIRYKKASIDDMVAEVYVDSSDLAMQETGGVRSEVGEFRVPVGVYEVFGLDPKKVIPQSMRARNILGKTIKGVVPFVSNVNGLEGVWAKTDDGQRLLYALSPQLEFEPRPWFYEPVLEAFEDNLEQQFDQAAEEQLNRVAGRAYAKGSGLLG